MGFTTMAKKSTSHAPQPPAVIVYDNPFGEATEAERNGEPLMDRFFLKGYSDVRVERELAERDYRAGKGPKPAPLPRRFHFVSVQRMDGTANRNKEAEFRSKGYRPVKFDELKSLGIDAELSTCEKGPDGTARVGSQMLMVADARVAAREYNEQRARTDAQYDAVKATLDEKADAYNAKHGHTAKTGTQFTHEEEIRTK